MKRFIHFFTGHYYLVIEDKLSYTCYQCECGKVKVIGLW